MGLENIGGLELIVIILIALFIFGPDRLPKAISDGLKMLRSVRQMARNATGDLSRELGTTVELEDLHPKTFLRKHLLSEADEQAIRKPLQGIYDEVRGAADTIHSQAKDVTSAEPVGPAGSGAAAKPAASRASFDDIT